MTAPGLSRALCLTAAAALLAGCAPRLSGVEASDLLGALFAPPTPAEIATVEAQWAARDTRPRDARVDSDRLYGDGSRVLVVSHRIGAAGERHVGAVRVPAGTAGRRLPVLVVGHGGDKGTSTRQFERGVFLRDWVQVVPSFRGERLRTGPLGLTGGPRSGGSPSPWDRDVDDAMALLGATLALVPEADPARVAAVGRSRGAGVVLLMAARDARVRGVASVFGPTDFFLPQVQTLARRALRAPVRLPGAGVLADSVLFALRDGQITLAQARLDLVRRSPVYVAQRLPPVQLHHGTLDTKVPLAHSQRLADALRAAGSAPELFVYARGGHSRRSLGGSHARIEAFLTRTVGEQREASGRAELVPPLPHTPR